MTKSGSELQNEISTELAELLSYQETVRSLKLQVADLRTAIDQQECRIAASEGFKTELPELLQQREDFLADTAMGIDRQEELVNLNEKIKVAEIELDNHTASSATVTSEAKSVIAGLRRKKDVIEAELANLKEQHEELLRKFLMSEAERVGAEYVEAAQTIMAKYNQLLALDRVGSTCSFGRLLIARNHELVIPTFKLSACKELEDDNPCAYGLFYGAKRIHYYPEVMKKAVQKELTRIMALGAEL